MRTGALLALLGLYGGSSLRAQLSVTDSAWRHRPETRAAEAVEHESGGHLDRMILTRDSAKCDNGKESVSAILFSDSAGRVRQYDLSVHVRDSGDYAAYSYDVRGILRYTYMEMYWTDGTRRIDRLYYDGSGNLFYEDLRLTAGPGAPRPIGLTPLRDPRSAFRNLCALPE